MTTFKSTTFCDMCGNVIDGKSVLIEKRECSVWHFYRGYYDFCPKCYNKLKKFIKFEKARGEKNG